MKKTLEEYELEERIKIQTDKEREISDLIYANKATEVVVNGLLKFGKYALSVFGLAVLGLLVKVLVEYYSRTSL